MFQHALPDNLFHSIREACVRLQQKEEKLFKGHRIGALKRRQRQKAAEYGSLAHNCPQLEHVSAVLFAIWTFGIHTNVYPSFSLFGS
jgi:hypothetical protein